MAKLVWRIKLVAELHRSRATVQPFLDVLELDRPRALRANLGLTLSEAKQLLTRVQQAVATIQARDHAALRPACSCCGARCHAKDWQSR